jgi:hypothetical protein
VALEGDLVGIDVLHFAAEALEGNLGLLCTGQHGVLASLELEVEASDLAVVGGFQFTHLGIEVGLLLT